MLTTYFKVLMTSMMMCISFQGISGELVKAIPFNINSGIIPPYTTKERNGFEDLLAKELYKRLGYQAIFRNVPGERGLVNLNQGIEDGILSRISGLEKKYTNILQISEMAVEWRFVAFTNNNDVQIKSWQDFEKYDVAYLTGWKIFDINIKKYHSIKRVQKPKQLFQLLNSNRVDVVVFALKPGMWRIKKLGFNNIRALQPDLAKKKKYFYMNKKYKKLVPKAVETLKFIKEDGTYDKLYRESITDKLP